MLEAGVYFPPSPVEAFFFSSAHGDAEVDFTLEQAKAAFRGL
jgi:glutamate-1-semialdehyde 2,1-aminomutase